jgi:putative ATP-grasp target RiPP
MSTAVSPVEQFATDPFADHSARFPMSRTNPPVSLAVPSEPAIRPWGLRGMRPARQQGDPVREQFAYDHDLQLAVDGKGRMLLSAAPTAVKQSNNDGDEGPSEDWKNDFCPDSPYSV